MRIGENNSGFGFQWNKVHKDLAKVQEKLSTGKAVNHASDDAAMMAVIQEFDKQVRALSGASQSISYGQNALDISDGGASAITDMLQRQHELALQASSGTLNSDQLSAIDNEYQAISQEINRVAASTEYNGQSLLNGQGPLADGSGKVRVGPGGGADDSIQMASSDLTLPGLGMQGLTLNSQGGAENALRTIEDALNKVTSSRAERGAQSNRLDFAYENSQNQWVQTTRSLSQIQDVDMAQALTEQTRLSLLSQTNAEAISQFNQLSRTHLLGLLHG
jgi:flagellin